MFLIQIYKRDVYEVDVLKLILTLASHVSN